jgi:hypothetical protein
VPPPSYVVELIHCKNYSAFFFAAVLFGFAGASAVAVSALFLEALLFKRALMAFLLLVTPNEPVVRFPFFDFLSPLPIWISEIDAAIIVKSALITNIVLKKKMILSELNPKESFV